MLGDLCHDLQSPVGAPPALNVIPHSLSCPETRTINRSNQDQQDQAEWRQASQQTIQHIRWLAANGLHSK